MNIYPEYQHQRLLDVIEAYLLGKDGGKGRALPHGILDELAIEDSGNSEVSPLEAAVARILLHPVRRRLPYTLRREDGRLLSTRRKWKQLSEPEVRLQPELLFSVNWAFTLGGTWVESFFTTFIPGFQAQVVTASVGSAEAFGYLDYAIGFEMPAARRLSGSRGCKGCLLQYLDNRRELGQDRWAEVLSHGLIKADELLAIEEAVWGKFEEADEFLADSI
jgi:hypothetical protein